MTVIENIVIGLQIGMQIVAAYYVFRIMILQVTPTSPYLLLFIGFALRAVILFNNLRTFLPHDLKLLLQFIVSVFSMIAFTQIFWLIKNRQQ